MDSKNIIVRIVSADISMPFGQRKLGVQPVGDLLLVVEGVPLYSGDLESSNLAEFDKGIVLGVEGLRVLCQRLEAALYLDVDRKDF